jgi:hypothetical protein
MPLESPAHLGYSFDAPTAVGDRRGNRVTGARAPSEAFFCAPRFCYGGRCEAGSNPGQSPSAGFPPSHRPPPLRGKRSADSTARSLSCAS